MMSSGTYNPSIKRRTLHGCYGDASGGTKRARNILQHDLSYVKVPAFAKSLPEALQKPLENLLKMAANVDIDHLGYSQF